MFLVSGNAAAAAAIPTETASTLPVSDVTVTEPVELAQVNSISDLSEVLLDDSAFSALRATFKF